MTEISVTSRIIKSIDFDRTDGRLMLRFANGQSRVFQDVPLTAVMEMVEAPSPGRHYVDSFRHRFRRAA